MNLKKILSSLTFRFMFSYVAALSLAGFTLLALLFTSYSLNYFSSVNQSTQAESARLLDIYQRGGRAALEAAFAVPQTGRAEQHFLYLLADSNHRRLAGTLQEWPSETFQSWSALDHGVSFQQLTQGRVQLITTIAPLDNGQLLLVARDYGDNLLLEHIIFNVMVRSLVLMILLGAVGGALLAGSGLRRVDLINRTVESIVQGDLSRRIEVAGFHGDFRRLTVTFNRMLDRIQMLMEGLRQVSDNIAHDLRTPLTRLRNHLTELQDSVDGESQDKVQDLLDEADNLLSTFNALLRIAQIESGNRLSEFQVFDITVILRDVMELYEPLAAEKHVAVSTDLRGPLHIRGDRDLLFQAFANLLDNAIKYTPHAGVVRVAASIAGSTLQVDVEDSGMGIPLAERDKVFQRFYRVEVSRGQQPGNGLGLSLVRAVVNLHSGSIALRDCNPGLGVAVRLPALISSPA
jgi:signal transduction histidine kinase